MDEAHELVEACELATKELRNLLRERPVEGEDPPPKRARSADPVSDDEDESEDGDSDSESESESESEDEADDGPRALPSTPSPIKFVLHKRKHSRQISDLQWIALFLRQRAEQGDPRGSSLLLAANLIDSPL